MNDLKQHVETALLRLDLWLKDLPPTTFPELHSIARDLRAALSTAERRES